MTMRAFIALLLLLWSPTAFAQSVPWRVTEAAGQVEVRRGAQAVAARRGATVAPGDVVSTGANGRAVLVRGRDFVIVSPSTQLRVPGAQERGGSRHVRMLQASGRAQYRIERRATPHFGVRTPHLVALVKGTVFDVTVSEDGATVSVSEGRVEVTTPAGTMSQLVEAGFAASVSAGEPERLTHGRSDEAQAAASGRGRSDRASRGGASAEHRRDGERRRGRDRAPRLEYGLIDGPGGRGPRGNEHGRIRDAERAFDRAARDHRPNPGGNGNGPGGNGGGNGNGNGGNGNDGGNGGNGGGNGGGSSPPSPPSSGSTTPPPPSGSTTPPPPPPPSESTTPPPPPPTTTEPAPPPPPPPTTEPAPPPPPPTTSEPAPPPPTTTTSPTSPPPPTTTSQPTEPSRCLLGLVCL